MILQGDDSLQHTYVRDDDVPYSHPQSSITMNSGRVRPRRVMFLQSHYYLVY